MRLNIALVSLVVSIQITSCGNSTFHGNVLTSKVLNDSFEIYVSLPPNYDSANAYDVLYYLDANLKSGKKIREMINDTQYSLKVGKTIFVGIGHIGDYRALRRRDFIFPHIEQGDTAPISANFGQAEKFYAFLTSELMPKIDSSYKTNAGHNSILGHSLGGLFVFYCLFKNDATFSNYFALSPSLWIDDDGIYKFDNLDTGPPNSKFLYFSSGSLEYLNKISKGNNRMEKYLNEKNFGNLNFECQIHKGSTHNSHVKISLNDIFKKRIAVNQ